MTITTIYALLLCTIYQGCSSETVIDKVAEGISIVIQDKLKDARYTNVMIDLSNIERDVFIYTALLPLARQFRTRSNFEKLLPGRNYKGYTSTPFLDKEPILIESANYCYNAIRARALELTTAPSDSRISGVSRENSLIPVP